MLSMIWGLSRGLLQFKKHSFTIIHTVLHIVLNIQKWFNSGTLNNHTGLCFSFFSKCDFHPHKNFLKCTLHFWMLTICYLAIHRMIHPCLHPNFIHPSLSSNENKNKDNNKEKKEKKEFCVRPWHSFWSLRRIGSEGRCRIRTSAMPSSGSTCRPPRPIARSWRRRGRSLWRLTAAGPRTRTTTSSCRTSPWAVSLGVTIPTTRFRLLLIRSLSGNWGIFFLGSHFALSGRLTETLVVNKVFEVMVYR